MNAQVNKLNKMKNIIIILFFLPVVTFSQSIEIPDINGATPLWADFIKIQNSDTLIHGMGYYSHIYLDENDVLIKLDVANLLINNADSLPDHLTGGAVFRSYNLSTGELNWSLDQVSPYNVDDLTSFHEVYIDEEHITTTGIVSQDSMPSYGGVFDWTYNKNKVKLHKLKIDKRSGEIIESSKGQDTISDVYGYLLRPYFNGEEFVQINLSPILWSTVSKTHYDVTPLYDDMDIDSSRVYTLTIENNGDHFRYNSSPLFFQLRNQNLLTLRRYFDTLDNKKEYNSTILYNLDISDADNVKYDEWDLTAYFSDPNPFYPNTVMVEKEDNIWIGTNAFEDGEYFWYYLWLKSDGTVKNRIEKVVINDEEYRNMSPLSFREDHYYTVASRSEDTLYHMDILKINGSGNHEVVGSFSSSRYITRFKHTLYDEASGILIFTCKLDDKYHMIMAFDGSDLGIEPKTSYVIDEKVDFLMYPNPVLDRLTIDGMSEFKGYIRIYDMQGHEVYNTKTRFNGSYHIPTTQLPSGTYTIKLTGDNQVYAEKTFVKIRNN